MGGWSEQRTEPRVAFRAPVKVVPAGQTQQIAARALNVSLRGMLVDTPSPYPVGTPIVCQVTFPDGNKALRGRVVRVQQLSPTSTGIGIVFLDLSSTDMAALRHLVDGTSDETQELSVRVDGKTWMFRGTALLSDNGYQLNVPLPFLRTGASVELAASPNAPVITRALVKGVHLEPLDDQGVPHLRIALQVAGANDALDIEAELPPRTPGPQVMVAADQDPDPTHVTLARRAAQALGSATPVPVTRGRGRGLAMAAVFVLSAVTAGVILKVPASLWSPSRNGVTAAAMPTGEAPIGTRPMTGAPEIVPVRPALGPGDPPRFLASPSELSADVGVHGSLLSEKHYTLGNPSGLAVNLPHASAMTPFGKYRSTIKGFREVWVQPLRGGGTHLRFLFAAPHSDNPRVEFSPGLVHVAVPAAAAAAAEH